LKITPLKNSIGVNYARENEKGIMFFGNLNPLKVSLPEPSSADKYYTTLPPVYNYSHYASIEVFIRLLEAS